MTDLPRRSLVDLLDPRGPRPRPVAHLVFGSVVLSYVLVRSLNALAEGRFVPAHFAYPDPVFLLMLGALVPVCALWPFTAWEPGAPAPRRAATVAFLVSCTVVMPLTAEFGLHGLVAVALTLALCAFGLPGGLAMAVVFALLNTVLGLAGLPFGYALFNGALLLLYGLGVLTAVRALVGAARQAHRTRELLEELEQAHELLRAHAARDRERAIADERDRMAREMHDSTGHHLSAVHLCLVNAERAVAALPPDLPPDLLDGLREDVGQARRLTKETLADTRRWVRALKPVALTERSGAAALRSLTDSFGELGVATSFTSGGAWPEDLDAEAELVAFRCVQEALTNALRHSGASRVDVDVRTGARALELVVADDGRGPDDGAPGFGLTALRERLAALGGTLETGPRAGGGFELRARLPLTTNERARELEAA
ncbi:sensor histidine kinase [Nocardiopsis sp. NPDC006938]|uniref:sensor histidine kinase n=1 Tax=Nocardiopsis sp. NPDC006938 TaxID=3364337 RepID=UPI0036A72D42